MPLTNAVATSIPINIAGSADTAASSLSFTGAGQSNSVDVTGTLVINIPGGGSGLPIQATGSAIATATTLNFVGTGVPGNVSNNAGVVSVTMSAGGGGSPGGTSGTIQFNQGAVFGGAEECTISAQGFMNINASLSGGPHFAVTTPAANTGTFFVRSKAGRTMPAYKGPSGLEYPFQPMIGMNKIRWWQANGNSTTVSSFGLAWATSGTATAANVATTNFSSSLARLDYVSAATAGQSGGIRGPAAMFWRGNGAGLGGFYMVTRFVVPIAPAITSQRVFCGFASGTLPMGFADPSTGQQLVGIGKDAADATYQFMENAASTTTKTTTGITAVVGDVIESRIFCGPNGTTIGMSIEVWPGASASTSVSNYAERTSGANIPANTLLLVPHLFVSTNTTTAVRVPIISQYIETDN